MIPFNKPYLTGNELLYISQAVSSGKISGNGIFTQRCQKYFEDHFGFKKALLTTSCTDALEMCAMLINIRPGDEVIVPSYTFVSTALAFVRQGAKIVFVDSRRDHPGIDENSIEGLITDKTRAIVPVHYAGVACEMDKIMKLAGKYNLVVIEDAAQAIDSYFKGMSLGSIGHLATFSFHETKNINSGEGGLIAINDDKYIRRAEIIWEKGTNRAEFFRGEVNKYSWVDIGSSFLPSELTAAFLYSQIENLKTIQEKRKMLWYEYLTLLFPLEEKGFIDLPCIPKYATHNAHMFYIICKNISCRSNLISYLKQRGILSVFHYLPLHLSPFYSDNHDGRKLSECIKYSDCLLRLPLYYELSIDDVKLISDNIIDFFKETNPLY